MAEAVTQAKGKLGSGTLSERRLETQFLPSRQSVSIQDRDRARQEEGGRMDARPADTLGRAPAHLLVCPHTCAAAHFFFPFAYLTSPSFSCTMLAGRHLLRQLHLRCSLLLDPSFLPYPLGYMRNMVLEYHATFRLFCCSVVTVLQQ